MKRIIRLFGVNLAVIYVMSVIGMWAFEGAVNFDFAVIILFIWHPVALSAAGVTVVTEYYREAG